MSDLMELVNQCPVVTTSGEKAEAALRKADELEALGFLALARELKEKAKREAKLADLAKHKYVQISEGAIISFIRKKAAAYDAQHTSRWAGKTSHGRPNRADSLEAWIEMAHGGLSNQEAWARYADSAPLAQAHDNTQFTWNAGQNVSLSFGQEACYSVATCHRLANDPGTIGQFQWIENRVEAYTKLPPDGALKAMAEHKARDVFDYFTIAEVNSVNDPLLLGRIIGDKNRYFLYQWGDDVALDDVI